MLFVELVEVKSVLEWGTFVELTLTILWFQVVIPTLNLEVWPGYETSIRQHEHEVLLGANISHRIMRNATCLDVLRDCMSKAQQTHEDYRALFTRAVLGTSVLTNYNNEFYQIDDVDWTSTPESTFSWRGETVKFNDYMQRVRSCRGR